MKLLYSLCLFSLLHFHILYIKNYNQLLPTGRLQSNFEAGILEYSETLISGGAFIPTDY